MDRESGVKRAAERRQALPAPTQRRRFLLSRRTPILTGISWSYQARRANWPLIQPWPRTWSHQLRVWSTSTTRPARSCPARRRDRRNQGWTLPGRHERNLGRLSNPRAIDPALGSARPLKRLKAIASGTAGIAPARFDWSRPGRGSGNRLSDRGRHLPLSSAPNWPPSWRRPDFAERAGWRLGVLCWNRAMRNDRSRPFRGVSAPPPGTRRFA